jgi:transposase
VTGWFGFFGAELEVAEGMGSRVELFEQIRRDHDREGLSLRALAARHGVHRRTVKQALASAVPPPRKRPERRPAPVLGPYWAIIDGWLEADRDPRTPRKQRHTAARVYRRVVEEHGARVSERQVRRYVHRRQRELGLASLLVSAQSAGTSWDASSSTSSSVIHCCGRQSRHGPSTRAWSSIKASACV